MHLPLDRRQRLRHLHPPKNRIPRPRHPLPPRTRRIRNRRHQTNRNRPRPRYPNARCRLAFIVIAPQKPDFDSLWPAHIECINQTLEFADSNHKIDPHRRYITGLSQGGNGTFDLATSLTWQFAAAAPVCGWMEDLSTAAKLKDIPLWAFHGDADQAVKIEDSRQAVAAINAAGGKAKLTEYPGVGHNSWDNAYQNESLGAWFLTHSLD
ncbi:hypothetical protein CCB80_09095 [Armatimonadetes bacterium Uphvl-Ar1]|nr:hypothetical protein CCB80_09095 [Armatimonadetes bacterium Uphvl-Ar1]